jgi:hypothetical protein
MRKVMSCRYDVVQGEEISISFVPRGVGQAGAAVGSDSQTTLNFIPGPNPRCTFRATNAVGGWHFCELECSFPGAEHDARFDITITGTSPPNDSEQISVYATDHNHSVGLRFKVAA